MFVKYSKTLALNLKANRNILYSQARIQNFAQMNNRDNLGAALTPADRAGRGKNRRKTDVGDGLTKHSIENLSSRHIYEETNIYSEEF